MGLFLVVAVSNDVIRITLVLMAHLGWRLWRHVGRAEFPAYHRAWWFGARGLQPILWPGVAVHALGSIAQLGARSRPAPRWLPWGVLGVQAGSGALTGAWWGRQQARMDQVRREDGSLDPRYESLMTSHWLRIGLLATAAAGQFAIAARALAVRDGPSHPPLAGATGPSTIRPDDQGGLHGPR